MAGATIRPRPTGGDPHEAGRWAKRDKETGQITLFKDEPY